MRRFRLTGDGWFWLAAAALSLGAAACGDDELAPSTTTSSTTGGDTTSSGTSEGGGGGSADGGGGSGQGGGPQEELVVDRWGARTWGPILGLSRTDRTLWLGTLGVPDPDNGVIRGGLTRLDIDTGEVRRFESELPTFAYEDGSGPIPTAGVVADGTTHLVAAPTGIFALENDAFTLHEIEVSTGVFASPTTFLLDRDGGRHRIWAATDHGLVRMDADTFAVEGVWGAAELGSTQVTSLAVDPATGAVYASVYTDTTMLVARVEEDDLSTIDADALGTPGGLVGQVVWSTTTASALIAVASWNVGTGGVVSWDGGTPSTLVDEGALATAARGEPMPFGAGTLAVDDDLGMLVVGGRVRATPPIGILEGGGIVWIDLATGDLTGLSTSNSLLPGNDIANISIDPETLRTHIVPRQPCNEFQIGNLGLLAVSFRQDGSPRFERPILSGVRSAAVVDDKLLIGMRDDFPGLSCYGYAVQTGLGEVKSNHGAELVPLDKGFFGGILPFAGPTALDALDASHIAIGTYGDGTYWGPVPGGNTAAQTEYGVSLYQTGIAWDGPNALWLIGRASHNNGDPPNVADRGPRGAARLFLDAQGAIMASEHFVRAADEPTDIAGLPSGEITAIALAEDGTAYLACGTERMETDTDRGIRQPFVLDGQERPGGVAAIAPNGTITVMTADLELPDPHGIALEASGSLLVLDREKGLMRYEGNQWMPVAQEGAPAGAIPTGLFVGPGSTHASLYDSGAFVSIGDVTELVEGVGYAWDTVLRADRLLVIGTDEGLLRIRSQGARDVAETDIEMGSMPPYAPATP